MRALLAAAGLALASGAALAQTDRAQTGGVEAGKADGRAGGRTDIRPQGRTGLNPTSGEAYERARGRANSQSRGQNPKGSFLRPADTPSQRNRNPKAMGSGAPSTPVAEQTPVQGANYGRANHRGRAGGIASGPGNPSGAETKGSAGKASGTQPPAHDSNAATSGEPAR